MRAHCEELGWPVTAAEIIPDNETGIAKLLREWADLGKIPLILTSGGTGIAPRDVTPEATRSVLEREIPGLAELIRTRGLEQTKFSVLSRALAGSRGTS